MLKNAVIVAIATCIAFCGGLVRADGLPGSEFQVAGWMGSARTQASGSFSFCVVRHTYPNGIELSLARSPEGLFFLGLKNAAWTLEKGSDARASFAIDEAAAHNETASAIADDTVLFTFWPRAGTVYSAMLSNATRLTINDLKLHQTAASAQNSSLLFDLTGTHEALDALARCVALHSESATASLQK